jgi:hypothetical protein
MSAQSWGGLETGFAQEPLREREGEVEAHDHLGNAEVFFQLRPLLDEPVGDAVAVEPRKDGLKAPALRDCSGDLASSAALLTRPIDRDYEHRKILAGAKPWSQGCRCGASFDRGNTSTNSLARFPRTRSSVGAVPSLSVRMRCGSAGDLTRRSRFAR